MAVQTVRQEIVELLQSSEYTPRELASILELTVSRLLSELEHVKKSQKKAFKVRPASCSGCEFTFTKRDRLNTPSRCPKCRSERIEGPFVSIK